VSEQSNGDVVIYKSCDVVGYPRYRIGNDGSVWSYVYNSKNPKWRRLIIPPSPVYPMVQLCHPGKPRKRWYVHLLVLTVFVGPKPQGMVARHFPDRDPLNCRLDNLCWGTRIENYQDRDTHGTDQRGSKNATAKLNEDAVREIRRQHAKREQTIPQMAKFYGVCEGTIELVVYRKTWGHVE